jgi:hypothetical protein
MTDLPATDPAKLDVAADRMIDREFEPQTQHTPGPWVSERRFVIAGDQDCESYDIRPAGWQAGNIAIVTNGNADPQPNARLIAAAPDLLAAAIAMRRIDQTSTRADVNAACDLLDAAIAQAT